MEAPAGETSKESPHVVCVKGRRRGRRKARSGALTETRETDTVCSEVLHHKIFLFVNNRVSKAFSP